MKKQNLILSAALAAVFSTSAVFAEAEVTGKIVHESGFYSGTGSNIGDFGVSTANGSGATADYTGVTTTATPAHAKRDGMKQETSARIYIDGEVNEIADGATYHVELNLMKDGKAGVNYDSNESYTQRDVLREAYIDTEFNDWSIRAGKQQVVWGTADGMKLLDMINPTDYGEMAQNQMEDSRIPVWMINAETDLKDGSNLQVVASQPKENVFVGLNRNIDTSVRANNAYLDDVTLNNGTDTGNPFMMKGPNTITGVHNGFLNITPDLGSVATRFAMAFTSSAVTGSGGSYDGSLATIDNLDSASMQGFTVDGFESMTMSSMNVALGGSANSIGGTGTGAGGGITAGFAGAITNTWNGLVAQMGSAGAVQTALNLASANSYELTGAHMLTYGFDVLYDTNLANLTSSQDTAFDYMGSTTFRTFDRFVNARSQYVYNMPSDSDVDLAMRYKNSTADGINYSLNASYNYDKNPIINLSWRNDAGEVLTNGADMFCPAATCGSDTTTLGSLTNASGTVYGGSTGNSAILRFEQKVERVANLGGSFDMAVETEALGPIVIRGEALYTKGGYSPIIDKTRLSLGDMTGALKMVKGDRAKFVLGADITTLTNMMVSAQFIQDSDLDFVDSANRYTADYATMSLLNGFNKATKNKNFYSLFFSKPFGASGEHRWNNIFMFEENGGKWNRLDAEFSIDDDTQVTAEYNKYWGDANTQFGQLEKSSNIQVGVKYSF